jgi:NTP pyrophosphatase (non-canonical NTP hydrolase)
MKKSMYVSLEELKEKRYQIYQYGPMSDGSGEGVRRVDLDELADLDMNLSFMSGNEYQRGCLKTASGVSTATMDNLLLQGVMGMCGESGEAIDIVKKYLFQGHPIDREHLAKELGDVLWYVATTATAIGYSLEDVMMMNLEKLQERYGKQFSADGSMHRKEGDV